MMWLGSFLIFFFFLLKEGYFLSIGLVLDSFNLYMSSIFFLVGVLIFFSNFSFTDLGEQFFFLFSYGWIFSSLFLTFSSNNFLFFLLGLELCVFFMLKLILDFSKDADKVSSAFFMFFMNSLGSTPFMMVLSFSVVSSTYTIFSSFSYSFNESVFFYLCFFLILISKVPIFIMHFWLTKAHVSASGTTSMVLASLMLKIGTFGIFKFSTFFLVVGFLILGLNCWLSLIGSFLVCMVMLRHFDMKYVIACSSIVHMSFIIPMSSCSDTFGCISSIYMMLGHGLISYFLFFLVSIFYEMSINRSTDFNKSLEGLSKSLSLWFVIFLVLNLGFPPFISFLSEIFMNSFFVGKSSMMVPMLMFVLFSSVFYFIFLVTKILFGKKHMFFGNSQDSFLDTLSISFFSFVFLLPILL